MSHQNFTAEEAQQLIHQLDADLHQQHIVDALKKDHSSKLLTQLKQLDKSYPGGLKSYVERAKTLLTASKSGVNPYAGLKPECPPCTTLKTGSEEFFRYEKIGLEHADRLAFCLVAGGLGERLGYPSIKVGLPVETVSNMTYLEYYLRMIQAVGKLSGKDKCPPLAIMVSGDTHEKTVKLLEENNYFGFPKDRLTLMVQQKVAAISDVNGTLAMEGDQVITKPHGHGDVHVLMYQYGLPSKWLKMGYEHMLVFQDTNALVLHAVLPMLGVSVHNKFVMNSLCMARKPGDAVGAVCKLVSKDSKTPPITINVEYNHLEPLLKEAGIDEGDPATTECSPFPGNANILMFQLQGYQNVLERSKGSIPEFVNPKYSDSSRTTFKSPTRLECLMQELPRMFNPDETAGVTMMDRWLSFTTVKNNCADAAAKSKTGVNPEAPFTAEADLSLCNAKLLEIAYPKAKIASPEECEYLGIRYKFGPTIVFDPSYGLSLHKIKKSLEKCEQLEISRRSVLRIKGDNVQFRRLKLDGSLEIDATKDVPVVVDAEIVNDGHERKMLEGKSLEAAPVALKIRGYEYSVKDVHKLA